MIVVDASVVIDLLVAAEPAARALNERMRAAAPALAAPHLLDAEVGQVLRRFVLRGQLSEERARAAFDDLRYVPMARYAHEPLIARAFELKANLTFYDALYVALAEATGATLLTRDRAFAQVPGLRAPVEVV